MLKWTHGDPLVIQSRCPRCGPRTAFTVTDASIFLKYWVRGNRRAGRGFIYCFSFSKVMGTVIIMVLHCLFLTTFNLDALFAAAHYCVSDYDLKIFYSAMQFFYLVFADDPRWKLPSFTKY